MNEGGRNVARRGSVVEASRGGGGERKRAQQTTADHSRPQQTTADHSIGTQAHAGRTPRYVHLMTLLLACEWSGTGGRSKIVKTNLNIVINPSYFSIVFTKKPELEPRQSVLEMPNTKWKKLAVSSSLPCLASPEVNFPLMDVDKNS